MHRHTSNSSGSACGNSEEIYESSLRRCHVRVHENPDNLALPERSQQPSRKILFGKCMVAMQRAVTIHVSVKVRIVQRTDHNVHGMAAQRVEKRTNLPSTKMGGKEQHAFAARPRRSKVFKPIIDRDPR